jgi:sialate O-acetylesterase
MKKIISGLAASLLFCFYATDVAGIELPAIIADHVVLKQRSEVPLWGTETPGRKVTVKTGWDNRAYETVADARGNWKVSVTTPSAGGPYRLTFSGSNSVEIDDVLIGEVWIGCGQSNMAFRMRQDARKNTFLPAADNRKIRLFTPKRILSHEEKRTFPAGTAWEVCSPEAAKEFSAMAYYFALELQEKLDVPVGIINASWGGVGVECWMPASAAAGDPLLEACVARWAEWKENLPADSLAYMQAMESYGKTKKNKPRLPQSMYMNRRPWKEPFVLYNGMVSPCVPYALSGMIWYQGTSNVSWAGEYERQLNALIKSWREVFCYPEMPVIVGQITAYDYGSCQENACLLREAQLNQRKMDNTFVFCSMDAGDLKDIHPADKQPYGLRFAGLALNKVYGKANIPCMCPSLRAVKAVEGRLEVDFEDAKMLHVKGKSINDLLIAGSDGTFYPADAKIDRNRLILSHPDIPQPRQIRYLYSSDAVANLYSESGLPVFPFSAKVE